MSVQAEPKRNHRTVIRGDWVLVWENERPLVLENHNVVVSGNVIERVTPDPVSDADEVIDYEHSLILPGLVNVHSHCINGAMYRGIPDDSKFDDPWMARLIYELLLPMGQIVLKTLDPQEIRSLVTLGMLDVLKGGSTTLVDQWQPDQAAHFFEVANQLGIRAYGAPYITSASNVSVPKGGLPQAILDDDDVSALERAVAIYKQFDQGPDGRINIIMGPHAPDTCSPTLLRRVREVADDLGCLITIHLSQTKEEVEIVRERHGMTPVEYLKSTNLLGEDLIAAHCVEATDSDIDLLRSTNTAVANCTVTFAREGTNVPLSRFLDAGVRIGIGTDSHGMNMISELRTAGFFSKLFAKRAHTATAYDLVRAATLNGASALQRPDLGRIEAGAKADILVCSLAQAHLQPVWDPVKNLMWKGSHQDFAAIMVDGRVVVRDGHCPHIDERQLYRQATAAARKVWAIAEEKGILSREICSSPARSIAHT